MWPALAAALLGLLAAPASAAAVQTDYEAGLDLSPYATYAWKTDSIVAPGDAEVQAWIVAAVERELGAKGLRRVDASPDVWVVTYAGSGVDFGITAPYLNFTWSVGVHAYGVQDVIEGALVVTLVDPGTDKPVWRGSARESIKRGKTPSLRGKIDKVTAKMFRDWPTGAGR